MNRLLTEKCVTYGSIYHGRVVTFIIKPIAEALVHLSSTSADPRVLGKAIAKLAEGYIRRLDDPLSLPPSMAAGPFATAKWDIWLESNTASSPPPTYRFILASSLALLELIGQNYCNHSFTSDLQRLFSIPNLATNDLTSSILRSNIKWDDDADADSVVECPIPEHSGPASELASDLHRLLHRNKLLPRKKSQHRRAVMTAIYEIAEMQLCLTKYCDAQALVGPMKQFALLAAKQADVLSSQGCIQWSSEEPWVLWLGETSQDQDFPIEAGGIRELACIFTRITRLGVQPSIIQNTFLDVLCERDWLRRFTEYPPRKPRTQDLVKDPHGLEIALRRKQKCGRKKKGQSLLLKTLKRQHHVCSRSKSSAKVTEWLHLRNQ
ncbi:hypothetical protein HGRIS_001682 [Hohenbuehelia grisea]|uniref:Uncharacterized protein n=1 Tax=Hohenbuehelia grisea TaxID=104357 RepID=A0ABR3JI61_9AGAR